MALAIGFSKKYYTLWDITSREEWVNPYTSYTKVTFCFIQNLAHAESDAIQKAQKMGCTSLLPDHDLFGKNKSWERSSEKKIRPEKLGSTPMSDLIMICMSNSPQNTKEAKEAAIEILLEKGWCVKINSIITPQEHAPAIEKWFRDKEEFLNSPVPLEYEITRNINSEGVVGVENATLLFNTGWTSQYYAGAYYYLPKNKLGKGVRIKGKIVEILDCKIEKNIPFERPYGVWKENLAGNWFFTGNETPVFGEILK